MLKYRFLKTERIKSVGEKPKEFSDFLFQNVIQPSGIYPILKLFEKISSEKILVEIFGMSSTTNKYQ